MNIVKNLVDKSKYGIKCLYEMKPTRIVVHNTANDASAKKRGCIYDWKQQRGIFSLCSR